MPEPKGRKADEDSKADITDKVDEVTPKADSKASGSTVAPKKPSDHKSRGQRDDPAPREVTKRVNAFGEEEEDEAPSRRITGPGTRRWVAPAFIIVGLLGVAWLVVYYIAGRDVPVMSRLGDWNILIGMGLMAASLGLSMLWK